MLYILQCVLFTIAIWGKFWCTEQVLTWWRTLCIFRIFFQTTPPLFLIIFISLLWCLSKEARSHGGGGTVKILINSALILNKQRQKTFKCYDLLPYNFVVCEILYWHQGPKHAFWIGLAEFLTRFLVIGDNTIYFISHHWPFAID